MEREIRFELVERIYFGQNWVDKLLAHRSQFTLKLAYSEAKASRVESGDQRENVTEKIRYRLAQEPATNQFVLRKPGDGPKREAM